MLITFKSDASGDVMMFEQNAREALRALGKDPGAPQGIITVEQLPGALAALKSAIDADKEQPHPEQEQTDDEVRPDTPDGGVGFWQRAVPLAELLERSLTENAPVTWGI